MTEQTSIQYSNISDELKARDQWVCWLGGMNEKTGKLDKIPVNANNCRNASHSNPKTWSSYQTVVDFHEGGKHVKVTVGSGGNKRTVEGVSSGIGCEQMLPPVRLSETVHALLNSPAPV